MYLAYTEIGKLQQFLAIRQEYVIWLKYKWPDKKQKRPYFDVTMNKLHHMAVLDSIGKLKKHINQLIVAKLGSISVSD